MQAYGIDRARLEGLLWQRHKRGGLELIAATLRPPTHPVPHTQGLSALRIDDAVPRLTTVGALRVGQLATRQAVELDDDQIERFFARGAQPIGVDQPLEARCGGPVIARAGGVVLGLGKLAIRDGRLELESTLPGDWYR